MSRTSAYRGTFSSNKRPYVVLTADAYVSIQGSTTVIACGECKREVNINRYVTGINTEASIDSPPGSATITLSIPDNDVNEFYVDGQFIIIPMMEIEIYAKGYFLIGGFPQYYRIFWGLVSTVTKSWSNGVTSINISCRDILRWWELTQVTLNPAFLAPEGGSAGNYQLFGNQFAGANPYTIIIALAREAMGDFSLTTGSFTSFKPEVGPEQQTVASYAKDIMTYWQLKFGNIWNSLVLYGSSGQAYTFSQNPATVSPIQISNELFRSEAQNLNLNPQSALFKIQPNEIAAFKVSYDKAGNVEFFQTEAQSKLAIALTARDQAGYEFYCDTTGDIIFKPPFYNLNVIPNKPVSWIQDFEIIEDNISDSEQEVFTHVTSSGNAFGGVADYGLNDEITTPRTGVIDYHLLRRYGWRRTDIQIEWAGDATKLFYHLLDWMDRVNSKRQNGSITIPMRPEIRMGFPVWIPRYDSFFYVQSISHQFTPGGQATTTLTLTAKRSKFIAPKNIGKIQKTGTRAVPSSIDPTTGRPDGPPRQEATYSIEFPSDVGSTSGTNDGRVTEDGGPAILRDPKTGKLLGFPNAVMVYRKTLSGQILSRVLAEYGSKKSGPVPTAQDLGSSVGPDYNYQRIQSNILVSLNNAARADVIARLRIHRYEAGMSNSGLYDYAHDASQAFKEFSVIPADRIEWGAGGQDPNAPTILNPASGSISQEEAIKQKVSLQSSLDSLASSVKSLTETVNTKAKTLRVARNTYQAYLQKKYRNSRALASNELDSEDRQHKLLVDNAQADLNTSAQSLSDLQIQLDQVKSRINSVPKGLKSLNIMVRPVSDEFGFEVIGHYRYGRGAFIDRGQIKIADNNKPGEIRNQISIQFAASGGVLTDPPKYDSLGPLPINFSDAFEKMQPDDYMTGASFTGSNYGNKDINSNTVNYTSQQTYSDLINHQVSDTGKSIFAEADATRRSISLAELSPNLSTGLDSIGFNKCACTLGKADWLSVLPQSVISQILNPMGSTTTELVQTSSKGMILEEQVINGVPQLVQTGSGPTFDEQTLQVASGEHFDLSSPGGFFDALRNFLTHRFEIDYRENQRREEFAISGGRQVEIPTTSGIDNNILSPPNDTLFNRAAQGDPNALTALQEQANFNFGLSKRALDEFKSASSAGASQLGSSIAFLPGSITNVITGLITSPVTQSKPNPPANPQIGDLLNPRKYSYDTPYIPYAGLNVGQGKDPENPNNSGGKP